MCIDGYLDSVSDVFHVNTYMHIHKQREKIRVESGIVKNVAIATGSFKMPEEINK